MEKLTELASALADVCAALARLHTLGQREVELLGQFRSALTDLQRNLDALSRLGAGADLPSS
jgi:hypothetical protein